MLSSLLPIITCGSQLFHKISLRMSQTIVYTDLPISAPCVEVSKHSPKLTNDVTARKKKVSKWVKILLSYARAIYCNPGDGINRRYDLAFYY